MVDTRITDAEIAGYMGWRGPGVYTEASLRKIREIIDHVLRAERAAASEMKGRDWSDVFGLAWKQALSDAAFYVAGHCADGEHHVEHILELVPPKLRVRGVEISSRPAEVDDAGAGPGGQMAVEQAETRMDAGFQPVVAVAQEVDDEGLPPLPDSLGRDDTEHGVPYFTAEQYRQGQRDAVAADRARRGDGWVRVDDRLPEVGTLVMVYSPPTKHDWPDALRIDFDYLDPDADDPRWFNHGEHYEHFCCVAKPDGSIGPSEEPPYTHWRPVPSAPSHTTNKENGGPNGNVSDR